MWINNAVNQNNELYPSFDNHLSRQALIEPHLLPWLTSSRTALAQEFIPATAMNGGKVRPGMVLCFVRKVTDGTWTWHKYASKRKVVNVPRDRLVVGGRQPFSFLQNDGQGNKYVLDG